LSGRYQLGFPLFAMARVALALKRAGEAEPLLREALALRSAVHPADDPRILEVKVGLINALTALKKNEEASALRNEIEPLLKASPSSYAVELRQRLAAG
jgi:serine/threonine-protein kinase